MSHRPEESGIVPDDRLLVRPYVVPADRPSPSTGPAWPQSGPPPVSFRMSGTSVQDASPVPTARPAPVTAPLGSAPHRGRERDGRRGLPPAVLALLALGATGALVYLLSGPDDKERPSASPSPGLSLAVPVLPARSPGLAEPSAEASAPDGTSSPAPSASASVPAAASASVPGAGSASASAGAGPGDRDGAAAPKPGPAASGTGGQPKPGTLRKGDSGEAVRTLQERLHGQGFTYVSTTGVYDSQTERGVAQLQRDRGIKGDQWGVYGPATRAAFGDG